jgi:uncharacterized protein
MPKPKDRVVIDTNLWISFLISKEYIRLDKILSDKHIVLLYSQQLIDEFIEVALRPKFKKYFSAEDLQALLISMSDKAIFIEVSSTVNVCRDTKDNFLLALAKDGKASHLLTGDKDLLVLKTFGKTKILTITDYLT